MKKPIQYFSDEYLEQCHKMSPLEIADFLESFFCLNEANSQGKKKKSRLISIKIPEDLLTTFKFKSKSQGIPYQSQIKRLMETWLKS